MNNNIVRNEQLQLTSHWEITKYAIYRLPSDILFWFFNSMLIISKIDLKQLETSL